MRVRSAFALTSLCALSALAQPRTQPFRHDDPPFAVTLPAGFERFDTERPTTLLIGCFRRFTNGPAQQPTVLLFARMGEEVPHRALRERELEALRRTDPPPFHFTDRRTHVRWLGFELDALRGESRDGAQNAVRMSTAVPLEGPSGVDSVLVTVIAPIDRAQEADRVFRAVLGTMHARSSWRTPAEVLRAEVQQMAGAVAVLLSLSYLAGSLTLWRKKAQWIPGRATALGVASAAWAVYALGFVVARPERQWAFAVQALMLAFALGWQSRVVARARR